MAAEISAEGPKGSAGPKSRTGKRRTALRQSHARPGGRSRTHMGPIPARTALPSNNPEAGARTTPLPESGRACPAARVRLALISFRLARSRYERPENSSRIGRCRLCRYPAAVAQGAGIEDRCNPSKPRPSMPARCLKAEQSPQTGLRSFLVPAPPSCQTKPTPRPIQKPQFRNLQTQFTAFSITYRKPTLDSAHPRATLQL